MCVGLGQSRVTQGGALEFPHTWLILMFYSFSESPHRTYKGDVVFVEHSALRAVLVVQAPGPGDTAQYGSSVSRRSSAESINPPVRASFRFYF